MATTDPFCGVANPGGGTALNVVLPVVEGWNAVVAEDEPPAIVTAGAVTRPTLEFELVTVTVIAVPPARDCSAAMFSEESKTADKTVMVLGGAPEVVKKDRAPGPTGPATRNPEGASVTVPLAVPKPAALAVYVAVP